MHNHNKHFFSARHWLVKVSFKLCCMSHLCCCFNLTPPPLIHPSNAPSTHIPIFSPSPLQLSVECLRENLYSLSPQSVGSQLEALVERTEDFTDSAYTSHEQRQAILGLCQLARQDSQQLVHAWIEAVCWHKPGHLHRCT